MIASQWPRMTFFDNNFTDFCSAIDKANLSVIFCYFLVFCDLESVVTRDYFERHGTLKLLIELKIIMHIKALISLVATSVADSLFYLAQNNTYFYGSKFFSIF